MAQLMDRCPICDAPFPVAGMDEWCLSCLMTSAAGASSIPGIRVMEEIARGGMAVVSKVEQADPKRIVAMKTLQAQWVGNEKLSERFRREAHVMAALEHPRILPIYEVGECDGLPWFTMKLAQGGSLAGRVVEFSGKWKEIARLIADIAEALSFAHERGVLHRDVKPGNVLFDEDLSVYLADFGLAKQLEAVVGEAVLTVEASVLGTPSFIAPELASGEAREATVLSDLYSLGAVLYELLAGRPPYEDEHLPALLQRIAWESPRNLALASPVPPRDLRLICERAMSREPERRYATAREMRADLLRFSKGMPVLVRPVRLPEAAWFWCRRHPAVAALLVMVAGLVVTFSVSMTVAFFRVQDYSDETDQARKSAEMHLLDSKLAEARGMRLSRQPNFREQVVNSVKGLGRPDESAEMRLSRRSEIVAALAYPRVELKGIMPVRPRRNITPLPSITSPSTPLPDELIRGDDMRFFLKELPQQFAQPIQAMAWSPHQKWLAVAEQNGATHVWDAQKKGMLHILAGTASQATHLAFSPDDRFLLTLSASQRLTIFDLVSGLPVARLDAEPPRGAELLTWKNQKIGPVTYDGMDHEIEITPGAYSSLRVPNFTSFPSGFCLSPDAKSLVAAGVSQCMKWDFNLPDELGIFSDEACAALTFSADGKWLYGVGVAGLHRWNVENTHAISGGGEVLLPAFQKRITAFSVSNGLAAMAGPDGVEVWDLALRKRRFEQADAANSTALSPDGKTLIVGRDDYQVWDVWGGEMKMALPSLPVRPPVSHCAFSPDGCWLATGHESGQMALWRVRDWQKLSTLESPSLEAVGHFTFSTDGFQLSSVSRNGMVETWDLRALTEMLEAMHLGWN